MGLTHKEFVRVCVLLAGALIVVLNQTLLSPAYPSIMKDLNIDATTVQWLTSGFSMTQALVIPLSAYLLGRFSTRKLFTIAIGIFAIGSLCAACAPVFIVLLLGRIFQAAAAGIMMPMVFTVILLTFPRERRGSAMGIVGLVIGFAPAVGPSLSGILVDSVGWRALFLIVTSLAVVMIIIGAITLENYEGFERTTFDKPSVALICFGLLSLLYGLSSITSAKSLVLPIVLIVIGLVLIVFFVRRQFQLDVPLLRVEVLKSRNFAVDAIMVAIIQGALIGTGVLLPIYIQTVLGHSALESGLVMMPGAICGAICGLIAGRLFDRVGARKLVIPGLFVAACGGAGFTLFSSDSSLVFVCVFYTILAVGMQFTVNPINTWGVNSLENRLIQHANPVSNTLMQVGGSLGTAVLVSLSATSGFFYPEAEGIEQVFLGQHISFCVMAGIMVCAVIAAIILVRDKKAIQKDEERLPEIAKNYAPSISVSLAMNKTPYFVRNTETIRAVAQIMAQTKTSGLPIVDEDNTVVGFISDGDIMKYIGKADDTVLDSSMMLFVTPEQESYTQRIAEMLNLNVMRIATTHAITVESSTPLEDVCQTFAKRRLKKVPVVHDGKLVGSISRSDIISATMANLAFVEADAAKK